MKENTIVSLADSNYFALLNELIDSIQKFEQSKNVAICILDAGLTDEQKNILLNKVDEIKNAEWDIEVPGFKVRGKEWLKSQVSRAFIPNYFPNYTKYLWIDCDAWVQEWSSIELYFKACEDGKLGITQTMAPGYRIMSKVKWLFGKFAVIKSQNFKHAISSKIGVEKAFKQGVAVTALRNSGHLGRIGDWAEEAAKSNVASLHMVNVRGSLLVAPFGGVERRGSTSPFCCGIPRIDEPPVILDFATSLVAEGKALVALRGGNPFGEETL